MATTSRSSLLTALIDQSIVSGGSLIISIIAARQLGPEGFGAYVLATGLLLFLAGFQNAFVLGPLSIYGATDDGSAPKYIWSTATSQRYLSIIIALICIITSIFIFIAKGVGELPLAFLGTGIAGYFSLSSDFWRQVLLGRRLIREALFCDLINKILGIGLLVFGMLFIGKISILMLYACLTLSSMVGALSASRLSRKIVQECTIEERKSYIHKNWLFGKWMAADYGITIGTGQIGPVFLASILGTASTGILGAVNQLIGVLHVFLNGISNYSYPILVNINNKEGKHGLNRITRRMIMYMFIGFSFIIVPAFIFAPQIISLVYSSDYKFSGVTPFRIICWVGLFLAISRPLDMALRVIEKVKIRSAISLVEFIFVLLSMYPAIRIGGIAGAALVLLIGRLIVALCLSMLFFTNAHENYNI